MTPNRERFVITLELLPSTVPTPIRLKRLLKYALRCLGLKCTRIVPATDGVEKTEATP